jgi:hypothetical protein
MKINKTEYRRRGSHTSHLRRDGLLTIHGEDHASRMNVQGADNKLGQFLGQSTYATAYHRNVLWHSLERCASLL